MNHVALRSEHLDMLSICTGGGGLDLGIGLAVPGARSVCMVEREAFAVAHLVSAMEQGLLHPAPVWSDARTFDGRRWRECVDGLIGGIPCQPHSVAGRKQGSLDERDLWSAARRIVVQSRAWFVLIENVGGMLSAGDDEVAGAQRIFRDLSKLGFEVEGGLFTAAEVGAPHVRERVFILGVADSIGVVHSGRRSGQVQRTRCADESETQIWQRCGHDTGYRGECVADAGNERLQGRQFCRSLGGGHGAEASRSTAELRRASLANARGGGYDGRANGSIGLAVERTALEGAGSPVERELDDTSIARGRPVPEQPRRQNEASTHFDGASLFPPRPDDADGWRAVLDGTPHLEPSLRRMADGMAAHVDELRMLGNGVVPLQAAHAFRTLCHRLAARGSAGAARLVRMMEAA